MKKNYTLLILSLLLLASCGTKRTAVRTQSEQGLLLPAQELTVRQTSPTKQSDTLMHLFFPEAPKQEVRAVWLTTLGGLDWPTTKANTPEHLIKQKAELTTLLDWYKQAGINTVLFQTRVRGSVLYPSAFEPWDLGLTGQYGKDPGYDPLQFAVEECHKRGLEIQAWLVAIPLGKATLANGYGKQSVVRKQKALCVRSGDEWFMDPGNPQTPAYLASLVKEIVSRYDVDGINLDYIRYPEEPHLLNDTKNYRRYGKGMSLSDWRRQNITNCVKAIYKAVKDCKPWVKVSSSPVGKYQDLPRYSSFGWNSRNKVFQETEQWFAEGIHDEIFPMMYFDGKHFYPFVSDWQENSHGRTIVPGLGIYFLDKSLKDWPLDVISRQIGVTRALRMGGQAYFRSRFFTDNTKGIYDYARERLYTTPALQPAQTYAAAPAPQAPTRLTVQRQPDGSRILHWQAPLGTTTNDGPISYTVYASDHIPVDISASRNILQTSLTSCTYTDATDLSADLHRYYAVTAANGYGKESRPAEFDASPETELEVSNGQLLLPPAAKSVPTGEWFVVTDAYGRLIAKAKATGNSLDVSQLPTGCYTLSATRDNVTKLNYIGRFFITSQP